MPHLEASDDEIIHEENKALDLEKENEPTSFFDSIFSLAFYLGIIGALGYAVWHYYLQK